MRGRCLLNEIPVLFEADTGSEDTVISLETWERIKLPESIIQKVNISYESCIGNNLKVLGSATVKIRIGQYGEEITVIIVEGLQRECLMGQDTLNKWPSTKYHIQKLAKEIFETTWYTAKNTKCSSSIPQNRDEFIEQIRIEFEDVIAKGLSEVTQTDLVEHEINLTSDIPIKCDERRTPLHLRSVFKKLLDEMLEAKVIQPSESAYSFPAFLVSKKLGGYRIVNSYEPLNAITIKDNYTVPLIPAMHAALKFATWMTTIDLLSGYYQVRIRDKDKHKSAFKTEFGLFEFTVLAMGLCNATATFQRLLEKILKEFLNIFVMVYIDDIVIYSETYEQHVIHTKLVLR